MYEKLQSHPNAQVSKKARQFMFSFQVTVGCLNDIVSVFMGDSMLLKRFRSNREASINMNCNYLSMPKRGHSVSLIMKRSRFPV